MKPLTALKTAAQGKKQALRRHSQTYPAGVCRMHTTRVSGTCATAFVVFFQRHLISYSDLQVQNLPVKLKLSIKWLRAKISISDLRFLQCHGVP